ncbi:MAG: hypothetical protein ACYCUM_00065 [Solirubrobacteraceae bacterium]
MVVWVAVVLVVDVGEADVDVAVVELDELGDAASVVVEVVRLAVVELVVELEEPELLDELVLDVEVAVVVEELELVVEELELDVEELAVSDPSVVALEASVPFASASADGAARPATVAPLPASTDSATRRQRRTKPLPSWPCR